LFDFTLVGSGLSAAYSLLRLIEGLENNPLSRCVRVLNIDTSGEFFKGVPYGKRSGQNTFLITPLEDFLPDQERRKFSQWVQRHADQLLADAKATAQGNTIAWLSENESFIRRGDLANRTLARSWYGQYLNESLSVAIDRAAANNTLNVELVHGEVIAIERARDHGADGGFDVIAQQSASQTCRFKTQRVLLAVGSPSAEKRLAQNIQDRVETVGDAAGLVENIYQPGFDECMGQLEADIDACRSESDQAGITAFIVGTNASGIEALYRLSARESEKIAKFVFLAPSGRLPWRYGGHRESVTESAGDANNVKSHESKLESEAMGRNDKLQDIVGDCPLTADRLLEAILSDTETNRQNGVSFPKMYQAVWSKAGTLLAEMSHEEKQKFVSWHGNEIGRSQRRMINEYADTVELLRRNGRLEVLTGALESINFVKPFEVSDSGGSLVPLRVGYRNASGEHQIHPEPVHVVINCSSAEKVSAHASSRLISSLIQSGLLCANPSGRGIAVDDSYRATEDFYVMGPLLAGNVVGETPIWHVESCPRIIDLSTKLATHWVRELHRQEAVGLTATQASTIVRTKENAMLRQQHRRELK